MAFDLTREQCDLKDGARRLCDEVFTLDHVRKVETTGRVDPITWDLIAGTGLFSLRVPEGDGGAGCGMVESALVFEELGAALVPGPLVGTDLASSCGSDSSLKVSKVAIIEREPNPTIVEYFDDLDSIWVVDDAGVWALDREALTTEPIQRPLDPLAPSHLIIGPIPGGERVGDSTMGETIRLNGAVLTAALLVGSALAATQLAVRFALQREQFGRPIGGFQAVKHILADMHIRATAAQAAVYAAAAIVDHPEGGDPIRAAAVAKIAAGEAAVFAGRHAIQVHGGMGFTWEIPAHLHLKQAWRLNTTFGRPDVMATALAEMI